MSASNGIITDPVSIYDIQSTFGRSETDLGRLIKNANINKWARYKPVVKNTVQCITFQDRKNVFFGLTPQRYSEAETLLSTNASNITLEMFNTAVNAAKEWVYTKPTGGAAAPFRLSDFADYDNRGGGVTGYKHSTPPPIDFGSEWNVINKNFPYTDLEEVASKMVVTSTSVSGTSTNSWVEISVYDTSGDLDSPPATTGHIRSIGLAYTSFKAIFATNDDGSIRSSDVLNGIDSMAIPLNWLLGAVTSQGQNWRMGLLVYVPALSGSTAYGQPYVSLFVGKKPFHTAASDMQSAIGSFAIDMATNQTLAFRMYSYVESRGAYTFRCLPLLIKGYVNKDIVINTPANYGRSWIPAQNFSNNNLELYSFPTGNQEFAINVGIYEEDALNGWTLGILFSGQTIDLSGSGASAAMANFNYLCMYRSNAPSRSYTMTVDVDFSYTTWNSERREKVINSSTVNIQSQSMSATETFIANNTRYYGRILYRAPDLTITVKREAKMI